MISTAFLVKAYTLEVNWIVIVSMITSFWSLSARVSSDDKQMVQAEWRNMDFKYKNLNNKISECFGVINPKWVMRVVLWRFLEISSRIVLLCLVWINVGGLSVCIMLAVELIMTSLIACDEGTFSVSFYIQMH